MFMAQLLVQKIGLPMQFQLDSNFTGDEIGNASVHSHELGHNTLDIGFLQDNPKAFALVDQFFKYTKNRYKGLNKFVKKAIPLTVLTAIIYLLSLFYLNKYYPADQAIYKVIFIGLASLTFPHILLEYLIEKNEK